METRASRNHALANVSFLTGIPGENERALFHTRARARGWEKGTHYAALRYENNGRPAGRHACKSRQILSLAAARASIHRYLAYLRENYPLRAGTRSPGSPIPIPLRPSDEDFRLRHRITICITPPLCPRLLTVASSSLSSSFTLALCHRAYEKPPR